MSHYGNADTVSFDWDEDGLTITLEGVDEGDGIFRANITGIAEEFYDRAKAAILPWLMERDEALREYRLMGAAVEADMREAYDRSDPKHPDWHSVHADIWDAREGK